MGAGIHYDRNKGVTVCAAYEYFDVEDAEIDQELSNFGDVGYD